MPVCHLLIGFMHASPHEERSTTRQSVKKRRFILFHGFYVRVRVRTLKVKMLNPIDQCQKKYNQLNASMLPGYMYVLLQKKERKKKLKIKKKDKTRPVQNAPLCPIAEYTHTNQLQSTEASSHANEKQPIT